MLRPASPPPPLPRGAFPCRPSTPDASPCQGDAAMAVQVGSLTWAARPTSMPQRRITGASHRMAAAAQELTCAAKRPEPRHCRPSRHGRRHRPLGLGACGRVRLPLALRQAMLRQHSAGRRLQHPPRQARRIRARARHGSHVATSPQRSSTSACATSSRLLPRMRMRPRHPATQLAGRSQRYSRFIPRPSMRHHSGSSRPWRSLRKRRSTRGQPYRGWRHEL